MRTLFASLLAMFAMSMAAASTGSPADRAAADIAALESKLEAGLAARDIKLLEPLLANRFAWVHGSDGRMDGRKEWLASAARGMALTGQRNARSEHGVILTLYGDDQPHTAVRIARVRIVDSAGGREMWMRQTHTLVRDTAGWKLAMGQGVIMYDGPPLDPALHARYAGVYVIDENRRLTLDWDDGALLAIFPNGAQTQVFLASPTQEALRNPAAGVLNFTLDEKGNPIAASLVRGTQELWRGARETSSSKADQ